MTPNQLLENVKTRFTMLLHDDEKALEALLRKALAVYQERIGVIRRYQLEEFTSNGYQLPDDYLARLSVTDAFHAHVSSDVWEDEGKLFLHLYSHEQWPITFTYLANIQNVNLDEWQLPSKSISILSDYLEALIAIPNAERVARISIAGKLDASHVPAEADLTTRLKELETEMTSRRAIVPVLGFGV